MTNEDRENLIILFKDSPIWTVLYCHYWNGLGFYCGLTYRQAEDKANEIRKSSKHLDFVNILLEVKTD